MTHKTVKRAVLAHQSERAPARAEPARNYDVVRDVVSKKVASTKGRISAKRLLPVARAEGYTGSARNFRRVVAKAKSDWRAENHSGRRPGVWAPGETLIVDWGSEGRLYIAAPDAFLAVAAGRCPFRTEDLVALAVLIAEAGPPPQGRGSVRSIVPPV